MGKYPTGDLAIRKTASRSLLHRVSRENLKCRMDSGRGAIAFIELQIVEQIKIQSKQELITWVREITLIKWMINKYQVWIMQGKAIRMLSFRILNLQLLLLWARIRMWKLIIILKRILKKLRCWFRLIILVLRLLCLKILKVKLF